jgi:hypothetical protein
MDCEDCDNNTSNLNVPELIQIIKEKLDDKKAYATELDKKLNENNALVNCLKYFRADILKEFLESVNNYGFIRREEDPYFYIHNARVLMVLKKMSDKQTQQEKTIGDVWKENKELREENTKLRKELEMYKCLEKKIAQISGREEL